MSEPTKLKHYELVSRLGEGGMGVVYRARDTRLGRDVALKVLPTEYGRDDDRARRFEREARIASSISHPGIATLYDLDREGDTAFLTMELVEGRTLRDLLDDGPLPMRQVIECAVQVAEALVAAHREGVIHRDLKPENIMAAESGYYKVLDFGVARVEDVPEAELGTRTPTRTWATSAGALVGTVAYMSPEQALGQPVDARSDLFSFGSLLHELATGQPAFSGVNQIATAQAVTSGQAERLTKLRPDAPEGLELVVRTCLAKDPADRYASAAELAEDLRTLRYDSLAGTLTSRRLRASDLVPSTGKRRWWLAAGALVVAGAALLAMPGVRRALGMERPTPPPVSPAMPLAAQGADALPASAIPGKPRVIVAFFDNNTGDETADWLTRGLPEMLTTDLSRFDGIEVIATQRIYDLLAASGRENPQRLDRSTTAELARWAGADLVIGGAVFKLGDRFRLDAQAYDTRSGTVAVAHKVEGTDLFTMVDELTVALKRGLGGKGARSEPPAPRVAPRRATSPEAYREFVRGKTLYAGLRFDDAADAFRTAVDLDPRFAPARLRLAMTLHQQGENEDALRLLGESAAAAARLDDADRLLALGLEAFFNANDPEAGAIYLQELETRFPADKDVHVWWARALDASTGDPLSAIRKLREAIDLDPGNLPAIAGLAAELADLGAVEDAKVIVGEAALRYPEAAERLHAVVGEK